MADIQEIRGYYEGSAKSIYQTISGETLHLGMVESGDEFPTAPHQRTKEFLLARFPTLPAEAIIFDLGAGFGDMARFLAQRLGCRVVGLNLVHSQNVSSRNLTRRANLAGQISTVEADFARPPFPSGCASIVWSQEAMLHAPNRGQVVAEAARLLQPGGLFLFTDILQTGPMTTAEAQAIFERVRIDSLENFLSYQRHLQVVNLQIEEIVDLSRYVGPYYAAHAQTIMSDRRTLEKTTPPEFVEYTIGAMQQWAEAGQAGKLGWGLFVARKPYPTYP